MILFSNLHVLEIDCFETEEEFQIAWKSRISQCLLKAQI